VWCVDGHSMAAALFQGINCGDWLVLACPNRTARVTTILVEPPMDYRS
jgi:hypothetical protein